MNKLLRYLVGCAVCAVGCASYATELVYTPINPNFGGNPLNGPNLLNNAQAQNPYKDPSSNTKKTPLEEFNETLQRAILNRLATTITGSIIGPGGELVPGVIETVNFIIEIVDLGGGKMQITTTDKATGASTTFIIDSTF